MTWFLAPPQTWVLAALSCFTQVAKRSTGAVEASAGAPERYLLCSSIDMDDQALCESLVARASANTKFKFEQAVVARAPRSNRQGVRVGHQQQQDKAAVATHLQLLLNGYSFPIAVRACALHKFLLANFAGEEGFSLRNMLGELPVVGLCQLAGINARFDGLGEVVGQGLVMKDVAEGEVRELLLGGKVMEKRKRSDDKLMGVVDVLVDLGLLKHSLKGVPEQDGAAPEVKEIHYVLSKRVRLVHFEDKEYDLADEGDYECYWRDCATLFSSVWERGRTRDKRIEEDAEFETRMATLCKTRAWLYRSDIALTPSQAAEVEAEKASLPPRVAPGTIECLEYLADKLEVSRAGITKESLAKFLSPVPALVPPFAGIMVAPGKGIMMPHSLIVKAGGKRRAASSVGQLTARLRKQRKGGASEAIPIEDGSDSEVRAEEGGGRRRKAEEEEEDGEEEEETEVGRGRMRPFRRRIMWKEADDVRLMAVCGQHHREALRLSMPSGEGQGAAVGQLVDHDGSRFDWASIARVMGMKKERVQKRHKMLRSDLRLLRVLERKIIHFGVADGLGSEMMQAGGDGVGPGEGDWGSGVDEDEVKEAALAYIRDMHTVWALNPNP